LNHEARGYRARALRTASRFYYGESRLPGCADHRLSIVGIVRARLRISPVVRFSAWRAVVLDHQHDHAVRFRTALRGAARRCSVVEFREQHRRTTERAKLCPRHQRQQPQPVCGIEFFLRPVDGKVDVLRTANCSERFMRNGTSVPVSLDLGSSLSIQPSEGSRSRVRRTRGALGIQSISA
jgi:hypothetical protein